MTRDVLLLNASEEVLVANKQNLVAKIVGRINRSIGDSYGILRKFQIKSVQ